MEQAKDPSLALNMKMSRLGKTNEQRVTPSIRDETHLRGSSLEPIHLSGLRVLPTQTPGPYVLKFLQLLNIALPDIIQVFRQLVQFDGLSQEQVNARYKRLFLGFGRSQTGESYDGSWCDILTALESPNLSSGFKPIHYRHRNIHQHHLGLGRCVIGVA